MAKEQEVGFNVAHACRTASVPHIIFCTQQHTSEKEGVPARHMVVKAEMEVQFRSHDLPTTFLELPCFYEDIFGDLAPTWEGGGENYKYKLGEFHLHGWKDIYIYYMTRFLFSCSYIYLVMPCRIRNSVNQ